MKSQNSIFRVRPVKKYTLDELVNCYLWFSKPAGFKGDANDANISAFFTDTPAIKRGFEYACPEFPFDKWYEGLNNTGICCFTRTLPQKAKLKYFPGCTSGKAFCIEYDRQIMETFFEKHRTYPIVPCFRRVQYSKHPTKIESCDDWSILWKVEDDGKLYRTIPDILNSHPRDLDELLYRLLTRISSKFKRQREERIILGAGLVRHYDPNILGYRINIPIEAIKKVYVYPNVSYKDKLAISQITDLKDKVVIL